MRRQHRIVNLLFWIIFVIFTLPSYAMQDGQATISVTTLDDYTDSPVESVDVRLLQNGSELASGVTNESGTAELQINLTSTDDDRELIPESFRVSESYPNPFESSTNVNLSIDRRQEVQAEIFNIIGQRVASIQVLLNPGSYTLQSSLGHLAQGVYFLRVFGQEVQTVKMTKIGDRISSAGAVLNIQPSVFSSPVGQSLMSKAVASGSSTALTLVTSAGSYDTFQQNIEVDSDTSFTINMSRNNQVVFRVADEGSPDSDLQVPVTVTSGDFSTEIITPDTLTIKSGIYSVTAEEGDTDAIDEEIEIASEDQTVTVLTRLKTLGENQLLITGTVREQDSEEPINRGYLYLLDSATSDTLAGPIFANSSGELSGIVTFDSGQSQTLDLLYRKTGYLDSDDQLQVTLPDTLQLDILLSPAPAPVASFEISGELRAGEPVQFDASASTSASGEELTYSWDFGNGKRGYGQSLSHVYANSGNYTVTLTVAGNFGSIDSITESVSVSNAPSPPAFTIINGEISTVDLEPLEGVTAKLVNDDFISVSGTDGRIVIGDAPAGVPVVVQLSKPGFAVQTVRLTPDDLSTENFFSTSMIQLEDPVTVPVIENGATITGKFGTKVSLPVDALVDSNGEVVTGDVELTMTPLDVSSDEIFSFPGGFEGVRPTGEQGNIMSFGVADFTFTQNGESLQVMPGKAAQIEIPVTNADVEIGDNIPLWTLDEETGLWIEEGTGEIIASAGSPTGLAMVAETGHFSWKNIDVFVGGTGFESSESFTLIPRCRNTETDQFITCVMRGKSLNDDGSIAGFAPTTIIPSSGNIELLVPLNKTFEITATSGSGNSSGSASVPPVADSDEIINITIDLSPRTISSAIPIAYGDFLKGKSSSSEITRYTFEGEQDDFIRVEIREATGFEGSGDIILLNSNDEILQQETYANNFTRYLFENLPETGTYFIDVIANTDISNFDIGLELFDGPVNREISYGERIFDFLWPGTVNTYTFQGELEDVLEIIAQNFPTGESWPANLTIKTPNPLVDYNASFFNYDVWVQRLEEKDGNYSLEVSGANSQNHGQYIIDFNTIDNFVDETSEIAYGDSVLSPVYEINQINKYTFEGTAGDLIRLHIEKPYPRESTNQLIPEMKLYSPDNSLLDNVTTSFRFGPDAGIGYFLPENGIYKIEVTGNANNLSPEGDLYSLLLRKIENLQAKSFEDFNLEIIRNEFFENELDINLYTFTGEEGQFGRVVLSPAFASSPKGKVYLFDENYQFIGKDTFVSSTVSNSRKTGIIDIPHMDQEYSVIVVSNGRNDVKDSSNEEYIIQHKRAEIVQFNSTTNQTIPANSLRYFHFNNPIPGKEVSIAAAGTGANISGNAIRGPEENVVRVDFASSQSFIPSVLEDSGNYVLTVGSGTNAPADFDLTLAELEPSQDINLVQNDVISVDGSIRLSGDIDRFDFTPDTNGSITITLNPAAENSIDDSGRLRVQVRNPDTNSLVRASSETPNPDGDELYIWQGNVSGQNDYRIYVLDQEAITSGDFILTVEFSPNP